MDGLYSENLSEEFAAEVADSLDTLLRELEEKQPSFDLPAEFRPSLIRIKKSLSDSRTEEGNAILTPVINALRSNVQLNRQTGRMKLHRNIAYGISAASLDSLSGADVNSWVAFQAASWRPSHSRCISLSNESTARLSREAERGGASNTTDIAGRRTRA